VQLSLFFRKKLFTLFSYFNEYYAGDNGHPTKIGYIGPYKCEHRHILDFMR